MSVIQYMSVHNTGVGLLDEELDGVHTHWEWPLIRECNSEFAMFVRDSTPTLFPPWDWPLY